jgi:hypothetical protein
MSHQENFLYEVWLLREGDKWSAITPPEGGWYSKKAALAAAGELCNLEPDAEQVVIIERRVHLTLNGRANKGVRVTK